MNRAAAVAVIDRDGKTQRIRHVFFHGDRVGFLFARLALLGLAVIASQRLYLAHIQPALDNLAGNPLRFGVSDQRPRVTCGKLSRADRGPDELASSSRCAQEKSRRGLRGLGRRNLMGPRRWLRTRSEAVVLLVSAPISPIRDARPRPRRDRVDSSAMADSPEKSFTSSVSSLQIARPFTAIRISAVSGPCLTASWPGLSRPSTSFSLASQERRGCPRQARA